MNDIVIDLVDKQRRLVAATVTTTKTRHRIGHMPAEGGWFCCCTRGKRCPRIADVKTLVPPMETP